MRQETVTAVTPPKADQGAFWLPNALFFSAIHLGALFGGIYLSPITTLPTKTIVLTILSWQLPCFGITIGYHRLWSHRAFRAHKAVRFVLAILGTMAFQGSIKVSAPQTSPYKFTDDPVHDPYAATRGLFFSHMGWIFRKPTYEKIPLIERDDLERDPIVRFQHKYYVPLALFTGLVLPTLLGAMWGDAMGGYIWGGLVARVMVWHCTFLVNSLAHFEGLQPYTDEITARGNIIMAMLTCGEGNHNFHAFPHDYRAGPNYLDWDPSKWIIKTLHRLGLTSALRTAHKEDIAAAKAWIQTHHHEPFPSSHSSDEDGDEMDSSEANELPKWTLQDAVKSGKSCLLVIDGYVVDASSYMSEHPGGAIFFKKYSIPKKDADKDDEWKSATWAFQGGMNVHSRIAKRRMVSMRVARFVE